MPVISTSTVINVGQTMTFTDPGVGIGGGEGTWGYQAYWTGSQINFANSGTVTVIGDTYADTLLNNFIAGFYEPFGGGAGTTFWNKAGGVFSVTATGLDGDAFGVRGGPNTATVRNDGDISVTADRGAFGVYSFAGTFINTGTITISGGGHALGAGFGPNFVNSGVIDVTGSFAIGVNVQGSGSTFQNTGDITATSTGTSASIGLALAGDPLSVLTVTNGAGGVITGDYAVRELQLAVSIYSTGQIVHNAGTLNGAIDLGLGDDEIDNTGLINGAIAFGQGDDHYFGGGDANGTIYGGYGDDTFVGGDMPDIFRGEEGADSLDGAAGADWIDGGHDDDRLSGGDGDDSLFGGYGDDIIVGGAGNDELDGWYGADTLDGGAGADVIVISYAPYSSGQSFDTIVGFDFSEDHFRLPSSISMIGPAVLTGTLTSANFLSDLSAAGQSLSAHGAMLFAPDSGDYAGQTFLLVDQDGAVGFSDGADVLLLLQSPQNLGLLTVDNFVSGPSLYARLPLDFNASPLEDYGREIYGDFTIHEDETLSLTLADEFIGLAVQNPFSVWGGVVPSAVISNYGNLNIRWTGASTGASAIGQAQINLSFAFDFFNASTGIVNLGAPNGSSSIGLGAVLGNFDNQGLIRVSAAGSAHGGGGRSYSNSGTVLVDSSDKAGGASVFDKAGVPGSFSNSGLISAISTNGVARGVELFGQISSFINTGVIRATSNAAAVESVAVEYGLLAFGSIFSIQFVNSGLIEGDWAFREVDRYSTVQLVTQTITNSGEIRGKIDLGVGDDVISNAGTMTGQILLGDGGDQFIGGAGLLIGVLNGGFGDDTLASGVGDDTIFGENGNDRIFAGLGNDRADGGLGDDLAQTSNGRDTLIGGVGNDTLGAGSGNDLLNGGLGADLLLASNGNDRLYGGDGDDTMLGGGGRDVLTGGAGNDRLVGGTENDGFNFNPGAGADLIVDFEEGAASGDVIRLIGFGAAFDDFADVLAASTQVGANVVIDLGGGDQITLQGVSLANLDLGDFAFG